MKFPIVFVGVFIAIVFISESYADDAEQAPEGYGKMKFNSISIFFKEKWNNKNSVPENELNDRFHDLSIW